MTLRLHLMVAVLLFPALILAQTSSTPTTPQSSKPAPAKASGGPYPPMSPQAKQRAVQVFEMFNSGQAAAVWASLSPGTRTSFGSEEKLVATFKAIHERGGTETRMLGETVGPTMRSVGTIYSRLSELTKAPQVISVIEVNEQGQVDRFTVNQEPNVYQGRFGGYKDVNKLHLPFAGEWFVEQGGRSAFLNGNFTNDDQRFSLDFVLLKDGRMFGGQGSNASDYYCFGQPLLSPADGIAVDVEDGYQDNPPGHPSRDSARGNVILIAHGNAEFSMMDHLKQNSIRFKKGDKVKQGEIVAECGSSGPSPIPHIHYQLQNSGGLPLPDSLPAQFVDYLANGKLVETGELERGQMVSNAPAGAEPASSSQPAGKTPPGSK